MLKKTMLAVLLTLQFFAVTPLAEAEIEVPSCYPCGR
jgi:hypothetical protein